MRGDNDQIEILLKDALEARQAGVFKFTEAESASGLNHATTTPNRAATVREWVPMRSRSRFWFLTFSKADALPIAAALALIVGLEFLRPADSTSCGRGVHSAQPLKLASSPCPGDPDGLFSLTSFNSCMTGPGQSMKSAECTCADLDQDGDVDLLDFGILQRNATPQSLQ